MARSKTPPTAKIETLADYTANGDGWIAGRFYKKGAAVTLTPTAAKYEHVTAKSAKARK